MTGVLADDFDNAWAAFQELSALRLVEETLESEWTRGRDEYLALLIRIDDSGVREYAAGVAERISAIPGVEPYPEAYWHITVKGLGFQTKDATRADDISLTDVQRIAEAARSLFSNAAAFEAEAGCVNAFPEVVFLEVWNSLAVRDLNCRLLERIPGLLCYPFDGSVFLPHISIARFTSSEGLPQLKEVVATLRKQEPGPAISVRHVDLIRARLSDRAPAFELIERYILGQ